MMSVPKTVFRLVLAAGVPALLIGVSLFLSDQSKKPVQKKESGRGETIFHTRCIACHGFDQLASTKVGGSLMNLGNSSALWKEDASVTEYVVDSILSPGAFKTKDRLTYMPAIPTDDLSAAELAELVTYVVLQGGEELDQAAITQLSKNQQTSPKEVVTEHSSPSLQIVRAGETAFSEAGACGTCHSLGRSSRPLDEDLFKVIKLGESEILKRIQNHPATEGYTPAANPEELAAYLSLLKVLR